MFPDKNEILDWSVISRVTNVSLVSVGSREPVDNFILLLLTSISSPVVKLKEDMGGRRNMCF